MIRDDKTCKNCGVFYRGEGFNEFCTSACHAKYEYAKTHREKIYPPRKKHEKIQPKIDPIKRANDKWLKGENPKIRTLEQRLKTSQVLSSSHIRENIWSGKNYKAVRG